MFLLFASTFQLEQKDRKKEHQRHLSHIYPLIFFLTCAQSLLDFEHMCGISAPFTLCNRAATRTVSYFPHCVPYCENLLYRNQSESKSSSHRSLSARAARLLAGECARFLFRYFLLLLFLFCFLLLLLFLDGACVAFWCFFLPFNS